MELDFTGNLVTALAVTLASFVASSLASYSPRLLAGGGQPSPVYRWVPLAAYFSPVASEHKRRRAALDAATLLTSIFVYGALGLLPAVAWSFVVAALSVATHTDLRTQRLPHRLTAMNALASVSFAAVTLGLGNWSEILVAVGCGLAMGLFYFIIGVATYGKIGMGDVYLALGTGVLAGTFGGFFGLVLSFVVTSLASLVGLLFIVAKSSGEVNRKTKIPFGPYIALGAVVIAIVGMLSPNLGVDTSSMVGDIVSRLSVGDR